MALYKFGQNDIFNNVIEAHPKTEFLIHDRKIYYNGYVPQTSSYSSESSGLIDHVPHGYLSLYEINIDRQASLHSLANPTMVYPFGIKDGTLTSFKTVSESSFATTAYGETITGSYPMSSSLAIERYVVSTDPQWETCGKSRPRIVALKNTLNFYKKNSPAYDYGNKDTDEVNLVSIPSIFYGSSIKKGSVSLKYYITGSLAAELQDTKRNGELIQVSGSSADNGKVAGVVLYNEGFVVLTGSWSLNSSVEERYRYCPSPDGGSDQCDEPRWIYWGQLGDPDDIGVSGTGCDESGVPSSSFYMSFNGVNYIPTVTMLAHAKKGELNNSNNPTFLTHGQSNVTMNTTGSLFSENSELAIKNTVKSPYTAHSASFQKQTWISQIGIYDEDKNLIAIAKLANPVRKTEDREFTFKLKLDI